MLKKLNSLFITAFVLVLCCSSSAFAATSHTQSEAVAWMNSQIGKQIDYDKVSGVQCVDLAKAYYNYLGVSPVKGNGKDYATNQLPSGWRRLPAGTQPQAGDIAYYTHGGNGYGHVFLIRDVNGSTNNGLHQNFRVTECQIVSTSNSNISGLIRPDWPVVDKQAPTISNVKVTDLNSNGYTITCTITDNVAVNRVDFGTWTEKNGQDDMTWNQGSKSGNTYTFTVKTSSHKNETGKYNTHIYAYDTSGNSAGYPLSVTVPQKDTTKPVISNVKVTNLSPSGYTVTCTATDNVAINRVEFGTWTEKNGQDDMTWNQGSKSGNTYTFTVKTSSHKNESGKYNTHIYAYDTSGNIFGYPLSVTVPQKDTTSPTISEVRLANVTSTEYTILCTVKDNVGLSKVEFGTWTEKNGQDDLTWNQGSVLGDTYIFTVKIKDHKNEKGKYNTHIYAYDTSGNRSGYPISVTLK